MVQEKNLKTDYDLLVKQVKALGEEENYWLPVLANTSALLMNALPDLNWAGFYLMNRDSLVLGPFQGNPACIRIPFPDTLPATAPAMRRSSSPFIRTVSW